MRTPTTPSALSVSARSKRAALACGALMLAVASGAHALPPPDESPDQTIERVLARYAARGTYRVRFEQRYESPTFGAEVQGRGVVTVGTKGRVVWDYELPAGRRGAYDGTIWWMLDPTDRQVVIRDGPELQDSPLLAVLAGRWRRLEGFSVVRSSERPEAGGDQVYELTPDAPRDDLERVVLEFEQTSALLRRVSVIDVLGSRMTFRFEAPQAAAAPPAARYELSIPRGYDIVED